MAQIHELLPKVMEDIGRIPKDKENTQQRYRFRGIDDALSHCGPILAKYGVGVTVGVKEHKLQVDQVQTSSGKTQRQVTASVLMSVTFWAADGSSMENVLAGEGLDYGGDHATAKAQSAAMKQGLFFGLVIPVDSHSIEDPDRDHSRPSGNGHRDKGDPTAAASTFAAGLAAIRNAPTPKALDRYQQAAVKRVDDGDWTPEEGNQAEREINKRRAELKNGRQPASA